MTETTPATPPAVGTPPAAGGQPDQGAGPDAGANQAGQDEMLHLSKKEYEAKLEERLARDRKTRDQELKDLKAKAKQWDEAEKAKMTELERLKAEMAEKDKLIAAKDQELTGLKLEKVKADTLTAAKISLEWIDAVSGTNEDEIKVSVAKIAARLGAPTTAQGAGNVGVPGIPPNSKTKIWTQAEIKELRLSGKLTDEMMAEIKQATAENRVQ